MAEILEDDDNGKIWAHLIIIQSSFKQLMYTWVYIYHVVVIIVAVHPQITLVNSFACFAGHPTDSLELDNLVPSILFTVVYYLALQFPQNNDPH